MKCEHPSGGYSFVKFEVPETGKVNISVLQKDKRIPSKDPDYEYASVRGTVVKVVEEVYGKAPVWEVKKGCFDFPSRDVWLTFDDMEPGEYYFMIELVHKNPSRARHGHESFVVSTYSECDVVLVADNHMST